MLQCPSAAVHGHCVSNGNGATHCHSRQWSGHPTCFVYLGTPQRIVITSYVESTSLPSHSSPSASTPNYSQRVIPLPVRHVATCLALHPLRPLCVIGTQDHGAFLVPLVTDKGTLLGDSPQSIMSAALTSRLFSIDAQFISGSVGSTVVSAVVLMGPGKETLIVLCTVKRAGNGAVAGIGRKPTADEALGLHNGSSTVLVSLWAAADGANPKRLLYASPPLDFPLPVCMASCLCTPGASFVLSSRREVQFWTVVVTPPQLPPHVSRGPSASEPLYQLKCTVGMTIPELKGSDYVGVAAMVPGAAGEGVSSTGARVTPSLSLSDPLCFALTSGGFLVCYDSRDGSLVKWMDCKVCPATSLTVTPTHVIVCGSTVRFFDRNTWEFHAKISLESVSWAGSRLLSASANTLVGSSFGGSTSSALPLLCLSAVAGLAHVSLFFSNGEIHHMHVAPPSPAGVVPVASADAGKPSKKRLLCQEVWATPAVNPTAQLLNPPSANFVSPPLNLIWWSGDTGLTSVARHSLLPQGAYEASSTCAALVPDLAVVLMFDTTFGGFAVLDAATLSVLQQLPFDTEVDAIAVVPSPSSAAAQAYTIVAISQAAQVGGNDAMLHRFTLCTAPKVHLEHQRSLALPMPTAAATQHVSAKLGRVLLGFASDTLLAVCEDVLWNVQSPSQALRLSLRPTHLVTTKERVVLSATGVALVLFVDPSVPREFSFRLPFPGDGQVTLDSETRMLACLSEAHTDVVVVNLREQGKEVERLSLPSTGSQRRDATSGGAAPTALLRVAFTGCCVGNRQVLAVSEASRGGGGGLRAIHYCPIGSADRAADDGGGGKSPRQPVPTPRTLSPPTVAADSRLPPPPPTQQQQHRDPTTLKPPITPAGAVMKAIPSAKPRGRPQLGDGFSGGHRANSCGGTAPRTAELQERYPELRRLADGLVARGHERGSQPPPGFAAEGRQSTAGEESEPSVVRSRPRDSRLVQNILRQSGLLLTSQVREGRHGSFTLRLASRWGEHAGESRDGGPLELPAIRSHDSVNTSGSVDDGAQGGALLAPRSTEPEKRHVDPAAATELLAKRMKARAPVDVHSDEARVVLPLESEALAIAAATVEGIVQSSVSITDSLARDLLAQQRLRVATDAPSHAEPELVAPLPSTSSPTKAGDVAFDARSRGLGGRAVAGGDEDDFVVMDSMTVGPGAFRRLGMQREDSSRGEVVDVPPKAKFASSLVPFSESGTSGVGHLDPQNASHALLSSHRDVVLSSIQALRSVLESTHHEGSRELSSAIPDDNADDDIPARVTGVLSDIMEALVDTINLASRQSRPSTAATAAPSRSLRIGDPVVAPPTSTLTHDAQFQLLWAELRSLRNENQEFRSLLNQSLSRPATR